MIPAVFGSVVTLSIALNIGEFFFLRAIVPESSVSPLSPFKESTGRSSMTAFLISNSIFSVGVYGSMESGFLVAFISSSSFSASISAASLFDL